MLSLPITTTLDSDSRVQCVVDGVSEQLVCGSRWFLRLIDSLPEQEPELRPASAELGCWRE